MEMAYYCQHCNAANLIDYSNREYNGTCSNCGQPFHVQTDSICVNTIIGERYQVREFLEENKISNLYLATDLANGELVILRVFCWDFSYSVSNAEDFLNTIDSIASLAKPIHLEIIDWGLNEDLMYTVWPCQGLESVSKLLDLNNTLEPEVVISICREIAICLNKSHQELGIGHFNLNPNNIFVDSNGKVRLADLGYTATLWRDDHFMESDVDYYDMHYVAPEVSLNWSVPDIRSDMFSIGCIIYFMVTGKIPFGYRGPQAKGDYEHFSFSKPDEFRLGETFTKLFYTLTEPDVDNRYLTWTEVINVMDQYLYEEKMLRNSSMSGRRRKLTTTFNFDVYEDMPVHAPGKTFKERKHRKRSMSSDDIKLKLRTKSPASTQANKRVQTVRTPKKKGSDNTLAIAAVVVILMAIILLTVVASSYTGEPTNNTADTEQTTPTDAAPAKGKKTPEKETTAKKDVQKDSAPTSNGIVETPPPKDKSQDPLADFQELKFQVRELTIRREWQQALDLCAAYNGPLKTELNTLIREINLQREKYLENKLKDLTAETVVKPNDKPLENDNDPGDLPGFTLLDLAEKILKGQTFPAAQILPVVEEKEKINLKLIKDVLDDYENNLGIILADNYAKEISQEIIIKVDGTEFKGTLMAVDRDQAKLRIKVDFLTRKLEREYLFSKINPLDNVKRLTRKDPNETALLKLVYLAKYNLLNGNKDILEIYQGPLKNEFLKALESTENDQAKLVWLKFLDSLKVNDEMTDDQLIAYLKSMKITSGDIWLANWKLNQFVRDYNKTGFYDANRHRIMFFSRYFETRSMNLKKADIIVSADGTPNTSSLMAAVRQARSGSLIRILPGEYTGNFIIDKKLILAGASGVVLHGNMSLDDDRIEVSDLEFADGYMEVYRKVRDVKISNVKLHKGSIYMRGENSGIEILNTVMKGLRVGENRQTSIKDCVILDSADPASRGRFAVSGFVSGQIVNSIIWSKQGYAMRFQEKVDTSLSLKHTMIYGKEGICYINEDNTIIHDEAGFIRKAGRASNLLIAQPQFVAEVNGNYRLKDFSPGFFAGENKRCMGLQYEYSK